jgi:hypothetical protein
MSWHLDGTTGRSWGREKKGRGWRTRSWMAAGLCMSSPRFLLEPVQLGDSHGAHCEEFGRNRAQRRTSKGAFDPTVGFVALCGMPTGFVPGFMSTPITDRNNRPRMEAHMVLGTFVLLSAIVFWRTLGALVAYSVHNESGSHIILIPLVSASLLSAIVDGWTGDWRAD